MSTDLQMETLQFEKYSDGLIPAIVQDAATLQVLMLGYMSRESLEMTLNTGLVTFHSRSRNELWRKGSTTGHALCLKSISTDCDRDALLVLALPQGPTCHIGTDSCFSDGAPKSKLGELERMVESRMRHSPQGSYTAELISAGINRIAQKVGEEGVETALAGVTQPDDELLSEAGDLVYHLMVLLKARGLSWGEVEQRL